MTDRETLPADTAGRTERMGTPEPDVRPGSWWRVVVPETAAPEAGEALRAATEEAREEAERLTDRGLDDAVEAPEHGVVLLVKDVAIVDGEIHSVTLHPHPGWGRSGDIRMLYAVFVLCMVEEPAGAELRETEERGLMGYMGQLTRDMSTPPDEAEVLALAEEKLAKEDARSGANNEPAAIEHDGARISSEEQALVPKALLPGQDLREAETQLRRHRAVAEARSDLMRKAMDRMNRTGEVVSRFQEEKAATLQAQTKRQRDAVTDQLARVHTMRLWLGEGVETLPMVEGDPAPADAPVHFMQQLLYLDEEIFVEDMLGSGFDADRMGDLSRLLTESPDMVRRLCPYDKCVTITRIRRKQREFEIPSSIGEAMQIVEKNQQDKMIQIFVRDGGRLTMIMADEETSGATQLFPSAAEIDRIYARRFGDDGMIDVGDIQYPDRRKEHEARALFYKRFLLILWGAHEREGVFGELPKGLNWLTAETQGEWFRFVHDLEAGLPDDMMPVRSWIGSHNARMRTQSRVVATWAPLLTEDRAPGAWTNPTHRDPEMNKEPLARAEVVDVARGGDALVASCRVETRFAVSRKQTNVKVALQTRLGDVSTLPEGGVICLDHITTAEATRYIESRAQRESYAAWLGQLKMGLPEIAARERMEAALLQRLARENDGAAIREVLPEVAHEAVLAAGWAMPPAKADAKLRKQAQALVTARETNVGLSYQLRVAPSGEMIRIAPAEVLYSKRLPQPFVIRETLKWSRGRLVSTGARTDLASAVPPAGEIVAGTSPASTHLDDAWTNAHFGLASMRDRKLAETLEGPDTAEAALKELVAATELLRPTAEAWMNELRRANRTTKYVVTPPRRTALGLAVVPGDAVDRHRLVPEGVDTLQVVGVTIDPLYHCWINGQREAAEDFIRDLYKHKERVIARMEERRSRGQTSVELWMSRICWPNGFTDLHAQAMGETGELMQLSDRPATGTTKEGEDYAFTPGDTLEDAAIAGALRYRFWQNYRPPERAELDRLVESSRRVRMIVQPEVADAAMALRDRMRA